MAEQATIALRIPKQDRDALSFCKADPAAFEEWISHLPVANLGETSRLLYQAVTELNHTKLGPDVRLALLEQLRPRVYQACKGLAKHFLNQPLVMPARTRNISQLAQVLQNELATGYAIVAAQGRGLKLSFRGKAIDLATPLHRAITEFSQVLLRSYMLFQPVPAGLWHSLHQLYLFALQENQADAAIEDNSNPSSTALSIRQAYVRALLLGSARVNQLRQHDLRDIAQALADWCALAKLEPYTANTEGLVIQPTGDAAPVYRKYCDESFPPQFALNTTALLTHLQNAANNDEIESLQVNGVAVADNLLLHLVTAWGPLSERSFIREDASQPLQVCFGLSALHYFLSGGQSFEDLVGIAQSGALFDETEKNRFLKDKQPKTSSSDMWDSPFKMDFSDEAANKLKTIDKATESAAQQARASKESERFQTHTLNTFNASPGGYGLVWHEGDPPNLLKAGELIGVRDGDHEHWFVAVIRWVKPDATQTQFGVEVLSSGAQPWGGRAIRKTGDEGEFLRVLLVPEIDTVGIPASLLTPRIGFRSRQKVVLQQKGEQMYVRLVKKMDGTGAWCRFSFDAIGSAAQRLKASTDAAPGQEEGFDSLWKSL
ncbi:MAG: hypothetical protein EP312_10125 [Gammaproteobacteria bacterium]|nr:MAG: hypothetical protein EP312_10125 [Gammaproteobacteria bacterium]